MQSKYKIGLLRCNLLIAALLSALMAWSSSTLTEAWLLSLASAWLGISALLVEFSHRRPAMVPWQLLPSLLLAALLWIAPDRFPLWLWAWAALIMLPQPTWMAGLNALLAALTWWWMANRLPPEHALLSGLLLAAILFLGFIRSRAMHPQHGLARQRARLIPGLRLWPRTQLTRDLVRERARAQRDGVQCELLLLRTSRRHLWPLAQRLCELTRTFEHCYRLDGRTLAALLLSRDAAQGEQRRKALLDQLGPIERMRALPLSQVTSLGDECRALSTQRDAFLVIEEPRDA
ncbi:hypothetical protein [Halomonas urumqiensis]|uniref:GGDEF domain-containing protein n=1 Tax=Halomonas urumqiensis TaxID=1684789 RepID=A0A2N7UFF9_9GAMM|nr:hypothetical protein [Halomonas urumqiensis]PMR79208.1 hypothetical protein C1H70_12985 [Halomonas urumqiensis]PTB03883.1 hypothetical protein C6V82_05270 [Halomonas urumqiensis]GHE19878.1 hypothetical protein GCM10017767_03990 [Halomonas urumqiensis]